MADNKLRPVWDAILDVYKSYADICNRHGLRFWAAWGSALGAVRHKGFIPWDDDLDVAMPRADYDRFINEFADELPPNLKIITQANTPELAYTIAKVQECRRDVVEKLETVIGRSLPQGVYIDIFPIDGCDRGRAPLANNLRMTMLRFRRAWLSRKSYPKNPKNLILFAAGLLCGIFTPFVHTKRQFDIYYEKLMKRQPFDGSRQCSFFDPTLFKCRPFPTEAFSGTRMMSFEQINIPVPAGYDTLLRIRYGDYMTPPPGDHHVSNHENSLEAAWKYGPTQERPRGDE